MLMMGHHNFKDELLIKRWWVDQKMNGMGGKFKDEKILSNFESCFRLLSKVVCAFEVLEFIEA